MLTIDELSTRYARPGRLEWIGLRSRRREPVTPMQTVELIEGRGLEGDHSAKRSGSRRQVTHIQWEHLAVIAGLCGETIIAPERLRRNLVVSAINVSSLLARKFRLGDAVLEGTCHCPPCSRMELEFGHGGFNAMRGHGGITARVLKSGTVSVGSQLLPVE